MPKIELSDAGIRSLKAPPAGTADYWDTKLRGFGCRVSQGGTKSFVLKLDNARRTIGKYPIISLSDARAEAKRRLAEKTLGKSRLPAITFERAAEQFLAEKTDRRRTSTVYGLQLHLRLLGFKGQLADIDQNDLARRLKPLSPSAFNHRLAAAKTFFIWAQRKRYITDNPTMGFTPHTMASRSRVLTDAELKAVWSAAGQDDGYFGQIVKLLILTGMRRGECAALRASWVSDDAITLPADATKNGREHTLPIGAIGAALLRAAMPDQGSLLFPARGKPETPFNGWSKSKDALDKLAPIAPWTMHDLRRTFATYLASMGVAPHVVERLINHVSGTVSGVAAIYNRYSYMSEMRVAIDAWEKRLSLIVGEPVDDALPAPAGPTTGFWVRFLGGLYLIRHPTPLTH